MMRLSTGTHRGKALSVLLESEEMAGQIANTAQAKNDYQRIGTWLGLLIFQDVYLTL